MVGDDLSMNLLIDAAKLGRTLVIRALKARPKTTAQFEKLEAHVRRRSYFLNKRSVKHELACTAGSELDSKVFRTFHNNTTQTLP